MPEHAPRATAGIRLAIRMDKISGAVAPASRNREECGSLIVGIAALCSPL